MGTMGSARCAFARVSADSVRRTWLASTNCHCAHCATVDLVARSVCGDSRVACLRARVKKSSQPMSPLRSEKSSCERRRCITVTCRRMRAPRSAVGNAWHSPSNDSLYCVSL